MKPVDNSGTRRATPSGDEDDSTMPLLVSRASDRFVMNEQPSKHYTRPYPYYDTRGGWGSPNSSYDPRGESSLQHHPVSDSWHHTEAPHSAYELHHISPDDPYRRTMRDDYIRAEDSRSSWPEIRSPEDSRYPPSGREWTERYPPPSAHTTVGPWPHHSGERAPVHLQRHGRSDWRQEGKNWHRDDGRSEGWRTNDSWESRQGGHTGRQNTDWKRRDVQNDRSQRNTEDRTWQPSALWQSSSRGGVGGQGQRTQNNRRYQNRDRSGRGGKKGRYSHQQRRDFRPDDSHLNNWTKREGSGRPLKKDTGKERQQRPSPSRSRSPGDSYHSYPSDRSRSPSQSLSPQRQQRDSSMTNNRSHTPSPRRDDHKRRYSPSHSRSPEQPSSPPRPLSPNESPALKGTSPSRANDERHSRSHKRNYSPTSRSRSSSSRSRSHSRSLSMSPTERPRAVHRLPISTSIQDIKMSAPSRTAQRNQGQAKLLPRDNGWPKRERGRPNGHARGPRRPAQDHVAEAMPPPALPHQGRHQSHNDVAHTADYPPLEEAPLISHPPRDDLLVLPPHVSRHGHISPSTRPPIDDIQPNRPLHQPPEASRSTPASVSSFKIGGFKPIGQASSAVRRFFPGDDDEREDVEKRHTSPLLIPAPHYRPPVPAPLVQNGQAPFNSGESFHRSHYDSAPRSPYSVSSRPPGNSPIHSASYPGHDEKFCERPPTHDYAHYYDQEQGQHRDQHESAYYHNEQHFSRHNGHEYQDDTRARDPDLSHTREPELTRPNTPSKSSRDELYSIVSQVGEGTFGKVYKARNTISGLHVALKRIRMESERDGFPVTAMREIKLLQSLRHDNIVRLYEMMVSNGSVYMVFEYMDHDLTGILSQSQFTFTDAHLKSLCEQMLSGLAYLHHKGIIHRDIKGSNILINNRGELKLGDFGLARFYHKRRRSDYTNRVITLWYRPPELLFGTTVYGPEVDMWSAGCIMLELFTKKPIFQGNDELHQLESIFKFLGTPTPERWPGVTNLPWYELVKPKEVIPNHFRDLFRKWLSPAGLDLAEELLAFDPLHRASAVQALEAAYFKVEEPPPAMPTGLSSLEGEWHELETKRERAKKRRKVEGGAAQ